MIVLTQGFQGLTRHIKGIIDGNNDLNVQITSNGLVFDKCPVRAIVQ